eukprot:1161463-Pelagomonas_calceolata.AAC.1
MHLAITARSHPRDKRDPLIKGCLVLSLLLGQDALGHDSAGAADAVCHVEVVHRRLEGHILLEHLQGSEPGVASKQ